MSKKKKGRITIDQELCKACYLCIEACPNNLIEISDKLNQKGYYPARFTETDNPEHESKCTACTLCATVCPDVAIEVYRD